MPELQSESPELSGFLSFLRKSPTAFHAAANIRARLLESGFEELFEGRRWSLRRGGAYFTVRNASSVIAFRVGEALDAQDGAFVISASHSDSPCFKIKENAELTVRGKYMKLNTEGYGGMICSTWMDRPLSVAGRVLVRRAAGGAETFETHLVDFERDLVLIPSLAIHMNRTVNDGAAFNKQVDMLPLFGLAPLKDGEFREMVAEAAHVSPKDVLGSDLYLYNRMAPTVWGAHREFLSSAKLDDLECAYATLEGFLHGQNAKSIQVYCCFDNEEVGSATGQGAGSTFLPDVLLRIVSALGMDEEDYRCMTARSFLASCDNAHAVHPNHPEKTDDANCVYMNEGIVLKASAAQKYTSDGISTALYRSVCERAGVPVQFFANRSDMAGGSTLGNIAMKQVSMKAVDLGLAQLAMHSAYETAGVRDLDYLVRASAALYDSCLRVDENGAPVLEN